MDQVKTSLHLEAYLRWCVQSSPSPSDTVESLSENILEQEREFGRSVASYVVVCDSYVTKDGYGWAILAVYDPRESPERTLLWAGDFGGDGASCFYVKQEGRLWAPTQRVRAPGEPDVQPPLRARIGRPESAGEEKLARSGELTSDDVPGFDRAAAERKLDAALDDLKRAAEDAWTRYQAFSNEPAKYVVRYTVDRRFGGREEGGWWYDHYDEPKQVSGPAPESAAYGAMRELNRLEADRREARGERDRYSMGGAADTLYLVESTVGEHKTTVRPHYE